MLFSATAHAATVIDDLTPGAGQGVAGEVHISGTELLSIPYVTIATNRENIRYYRPGTPAASNNPLSISLSWNADDIDVTGDSRLHGLFARSVTAYRGRAITHKPAPFYFPGKFIDIQSGDDPGEIIIEGDGLKDLPYLWLRDTGGDYYRYANPRSAASNTITTEIDVWADGQIALTDTALEAEVLDRVIGSVSLTNPGVINIDSGVVAITPSGAPPAIGGDILLARTGDGSGVRQVTLPGGSTSLIFNDGSESFPIYSPDGSKIMYRTGFSNGSLVRVRDSNGVSPVTILIMTGNVNYSWMGNNTALIAMGGEIYAVPASGGAAVNLTNTPASTEGFPVASPNGAKIAYQRSNNIYTMNADGTAQTLIFNTFAAQPPIWLTDNFIIVQRNGGAGSATIYRIPASGGTATQLGVIATTQTRLAVSSDNNVIAAVRSDLTGIVLIKNPLTSPVESTVTTYAIPNQSEGMVTFNPGSTMMYTTCDSGTRICEYNVASSSLSNSWTYAFVLTALQWTGTRTAL